MNRFGLAVLVLITLVVSSTTSRAELLECGAQEFTEQAVEVARFFAIAKGRGLFRPRPPSVGAAAEPAVLGPPVRTADPEAPGMRATPRVIDAHRVVGATA